jgi:hypothetical protein
LSRVASWGGGSLLRGSSGIGMQPGGEGAGEGDGDEGLAGGEVGECDDARKGVCLRVC